MKKFRPMNAGYIVVYVVVIACILESLWTLTNYFFLGGMNEQNSTSSTFFFWTLLLLPLAVIYGNRYRQTVVELSQTHMRIVRPAQIIPKPGEKRASIIFRQGETDNVLIQRTFELSQLDKYGYIEEFGFRPEDKSGAKEDAKLFPVHEVAFVMKDGRNCRMNAAIYKDKQLRELFCTLRDATGIEPTGKLAKLLVEEAKAEAK